MRRVAHKTVTDSSLLFQGIVACSLGLFTLGIFATDLYYLYIGAFFLSFTSGTVVTSLTSLASSHCSASGDRGAVLGTFRALGQLGRSMGPIVACTGYWMLGSKHMYTIAALFMGFIAVVTKMTIRSTLPKGKSL